jgi:hypothetical protein
MKPITEEAQEIADKKGITLSVLYLPGRMAAAYGVERYAHQFFNQKTAPILESKFSPAALAAIKANDMEHV